MTHPIFCIGHYANLHPASDLWMRGLRYGLIVKVGRKYVYLLHLGKTYRVPFRQIESVDPANP